MKRRLLALILIFAMSAGSFRVDVLATEAAFTEENTSETGTEGNKAEEVEEVSCLEQKMNYDFNTEEAMEKLRPDRELLRDTGDDTFDTCLKETGDAVRQGMLQRQSTINAVLGIGTEEIWGDYSYLPGLIIDEAVKYTGNPKEGDYLSYQIYNWRATVEAHSKYFNLEFEISYDTTAEQEKEVDAKVSEVLGSLGLSGKSSYEKIKSIYEWICCHIRYSENGMHTTAYNALVNGTCACQGYSVLLYRLLNEVDVCCHILSGYGPGNIGHCWNIAEINGVYYYLDVTWDQGHVEGSAYQWFLHGKENWEGHILSGNSELESGYSISMQNYPQLENTIHASNICYEPSGQIQTFQIQAAANDGAKLSYSSDGSEITVSSTGMVTIPAGISKDAFITVKAAAVHDYKDSWKIVKVYTGEEPSDPVTEPDDPEEEDKKISFSFWENYDVETGKCEKEVPYLKYTYGSFSWTKTSERTEKVDYSKLYLNINCSKDRISEKVMLRSMKAPKGFSFSLDNMVEECNTLDFNYNETNQRYEAWVEIYPVYTDGQYWNGEKLRFDGIEIQYGDEVFDLAAVDTIPVYRNNKQGSIEMRNSFEVKGLSNDWQYNLDIDFNGFRKSSDLYDHQMAQLSAALSAAAYHSYTIIDAFDNLGFSNIYYDGNYYKKGDGLTNDQVTKNQDEVACAFATKKYTVGDKIYTIISVAIRGTVGDEWYSNFDIGETDFHKGFLNAKEHVSQELFQYINGLQIENGAVKFLITGHSRGAAAANLLVYELNEGYANNKFTLSAPRDIYSYTFAAPNSLTTSKNYDNIYNIINYQDLVAYMPGKFYKAGRSFIFNDGSSSTQYEDFLKKFSSMWGGRKYETWENPNIVSSMGNFPTSFLSNHLGGLFADMILGKTTTRAVTASIAIIILCVTGGDIVESLVNKDAIGLAFSVIKITKIKLLPPVLQNIKKVYNAIKATGFGKVEDLMNLIELIDWYNGIIKHTWNNHAMETYIAWLNTGNTEEIYSSVKKRRVVEASVSSKSKNTKAGFRRQRILDTSSSALLPDFVVYNQQGSIVAKVKNGTVHDSFGTCCLADNENAIFYLDDGEYNIQMTGANSEPIDIIVNEYNADGKQEKLISYIDVDVSANKTAVLNAGAVLESADTKYFLSFADGSEKPADYVSSGDELGMVNIDTFVTGKGNAYGAGDYTKGEKATLYAITDGSSFIGWFAGDRFMSKENEYEFICTNDLVIEARFSGTALPDKPGDNTSQGGTGTNAGQGSAGANTGQGSYGGGIPGSPVMISLSSCTVEFQKARYTYDGTAKTPVVYVKNGNQMLKENVDYTVTYSDNTNAGTAIATLTGKGSYSGKVIKNFTILKAAQNITITPGTIKMAERGVQQLTAYGKGTVSYRSDNEAVATVDNSGVISGIGFGTATITAAFAGNSNYLAGSRSVPVAVLKNISDCKVNLSSGKVSYNGKRQVPTAVVKNKGRVLLEGHDYVITYKNNQKIGTALAMIEGRGDYLGTISKAFKIIPKQAEIKKTVNTAKGVALQWKKVPQASGYIIYRNGKKIKTVADGKLLNWTDTGAKGDGKKHKYKICAYKIVEGKKYIGNSSPAVVCYFLPQPIATKVKKGKEGTWDIRWKKYLEADGFQIQCSSSEKFQAKSTETKTIKIASATGGNIVWQNESPKCCMRIRAYKIVSKKKYYSSWSKVEKL